MPPPDGFRVTQQVPGGEPLDLTRQAQSVSWSSSVPGGFGAAALTLPRILTQKERGLLGGLTIEHEGRILFDGRVEDAFFKGSKTGVSTDLNAFGYQRLLTDNSTRRAWSIRESLNLSQAASAKPAGLAMRADIVDHTIGLYTVSTPSFWPAGYLNTANPVVTGFRILPTAALGAGEGGQIVIALPTGITGARIMFDALLVDTAEVFWSILVDATPDGVTYTRHLSQPATGGLQFINADLALVDGCTEIRITATPVGGSTTGSGSGLLTYLEVANIRVLGTPLREDAAGGFYGGTILRDIVAQAPGLYPGTIENGSDFVISEMQRVTRSSLLDVVQQIEPLYAREWAVWEAGRFDWITPDLASGGWLVPLSLATEWSIEQSIDSEHRRTYVTYQDAADGQLKEAFVDSTNARNPYVRTGANKHGVVAAPAAMTSITAPFLAAKINNDFGRWPDIRGSLTLLAQTTLAQTGNGSRAIPAFAIRAGDNITIPDLPVEDIYAAGQDGQTVFHVTGVQASTDGTVQLTLEGLTRRADVLLARLGAVSQ